MAARRSGAAADVIRAFVFGQRCNPSLFRRRLRAAPSASGFSTSNGACDSRNASKGRDESPSVFDRHSRTGGAMCLEQHVQRSGFEKRRFFTSNAEVKPEDDGGLIASQMIGYAASNRKNVSTQVDLSRVLEQGYNFLVSQGPSKANAAAKVLLTLATIYVDGGKLGEALDILQQATKLEGASIEAQVSTYQGLVGVLLRLRKDSDALLSAKYTPDLVNNSKQTSNEVLQELQFRSAATVQLAEHATNSKTSDKLLDASEMPSSSNHEETNLSNVALASLGIAQCAHIRGHFSVAKECYEKASIFAKRCNDRNPLEAMTAQDVLVGAEAGLGQVATQLGKFDDAERALTAALKVAEEINGSAHPRVGAILSCLADLYAQRGISKGSGDFLLAEGLYRKAIDLLGAPSIDRPATEQGVYMSDIVAISRARYGTVVSRINNRDSEAKRLQAWAAAAWKGPLPLTDILSQDASTRPMDNTAQSTESVKDAYKGRFVVVDAMLGRVFYSA